MTPALPTSSDRDKLHVFIISTVTSACRQTDAHLLALASKEADRNTQEIH